MPSSFSEPFSAFPPPVLFSKSQSAPGRQQQTDVPIAPLVIRSVSGPAQSHSKFVPSKTGWRELSNPIKIRQHHQPESKEEDNLRLPVGSPPGHLHVRPGSVFYR